MSNRKEIQIQKLTNTFWFLRDIWTHENSPKEGIQIITSRKRSKAAFALCALSLSLIL